MKSLNSKRKKVLKQFYKRLDRLALFGLYDRKEKRAKWKQEQEKIAIVNIIKEIKSCLCGKIPMLKSKSNLEYPESYYIECECGMRTIGYIEFVSLNPNNPKVKTYSKLESLKKVISVWNNHKEIK